MSIDLPRAGLDALVSTRDKDQDPEVQLAPPARLRLDPWLEYVDDVDKASAADVSGRRLDSAVGRVHGCDVLI